MSLVKTKGKALVFATHVSRLAGYSLPHDHEMCVKFKETDEGEIELTFRGSKRKLELLSFLKIFVIDYRDRRYIYL